MPEQPAVVTPRLELVPCSLSVANALVGNVEEGERLLDARLPNEWPDPELAEFLPVYARLLRDDPLLLDTASGSSSKKKAEPSSAPPAFRGAQMPMGRSSSAMECIPTSGTVDMPRRRQGRSWSGPSSSRGWRALPPTATKTTSPPAVWSRRRVLFSAGRRRTDAFASRHPDVLVGE